MSHHRLYVALPKYVHYSICYITVNFWSFVMICFPWRPYEKVAALVLNYHYELLSAGQRCCLADLLRHYSRQMWEVYACASSFSTK